MPNIKLATPTDIPIICQLAEKIWYEHYITIITAEQIEYMLTNFYSLQNLEKLMKEGQMFYLIQDETDNSIGYLAVTENQTGYWFMNKFYIKTDFQGKGVGAQILKQWEELVKPDGISLQVNRKNYKSINFYFKNGFKIKAVADFDIGKGYSMDDFIMEKGY